jgi:Uma2 family endonuclease
MVVQGQKIRVTDLAELQSEGELPERFELVNGEIVEMVPPGEEHGIVVSELIWHIKSLLKKQDIGRVTIETGYILEEGTLRSPDIAFIRKDRASDPPLKGYVPFAPDLAIEIVSPHDSATEVHEKVGDYLKAGTSEVWIVYPSTRSMEVHRKDGSRTYPAVAEFKESQVLTSFALKIADIFPAD